MRALSNTRSHRQGRRGNPVDDAAALSEAFLGRPAEQVTEITEEVHEHSVLSDLAPLVALYVALDGNPCFDEDRCEDGLPRKEWVRNHCAKIGFSGTRLCFNEAGSQGFFVGGDQAIDLRAFPEVDREKECVVLGPVAFIEYFTAKQHLDEADKTPGPYVHAFSEESKGLLPVLVYDTINERCSLAGGSYRIDIDMHGKYSAGIRD